MDMTPKRAKPAAGARTARVRGASPRGKTEKQAAVRRKGVGKMGRRGDLETRRAADRLKPGRRTQQQRAGVPALPSKTTKPDTAQRVPTSLKKPKPFKAGEPLEDSQQEYFCLKMAEGPYSQKSCYMQAYPDSAPDSARANASRLMTNDSIRKRIEFLRLELVRDVKITVEQQIHWYKQVKDTPTGFIDAESPLAQEVNYDGETGAVTKIKIPSKMDASRQIDKLLGFEKPQEINLNLPYEPPNKALERAQAKGVDVLDILKKAGIL